MAQKFIPKILLVEGKEDQRVIPYLMEANGVDWPNKNPLVKIEDCNGYENLANPFEIRAYLKSGITHLGIVVDADDDITARWQSLRNACSLAIANTDFPESLPKTVLLHTVDNKNISQNPIRFGIWIMPNNQMRGMLETFLAYLVPNESNELWTFAKQSAQTAKKHNAPFTGVQTDKANIYTWLAWQDPPGRQLHDAVKQKILEPTRHNAQAFVDWFKLLYEL
ncbi:hypothetical protein H6G45_01730 [Synechocystis sp. FACHB-383]|uniref:DUF3226 domain-containing protein n=1 Tax=Synechocystis sp. FACHB-383 TaxID=2692864 RepID=UPI001689D902|nr:DUF3226 domain-containing protein [Synechocystis sp. FACHB-383]MBD2652229.1 hypothetical protein [Synechocystis sp. FACHB-383]